MRKSRTAVLAVVLLAAAFLAVSFLQAAAARARSMRVEACRSLRPQPMTKVKPGQEAPDFEGTDASGKKWSLRSLRGRPVLLNFWATWCAPCVEEVPSLENLARRSGEDLTVLAVSLDEDWDTVKKFFPKGTTLSVLLDTTKEIPKKFGTEKYPETFLIDSQGKLSQLFHQAKWDSAEAALCLESLR
jgi:cytochrome c biogenesis protein CcmG, thiol:disulfide interchange protein DsbE